MWRIGGWLVGWWLPPPHQASPVFSKATWLALIESFHSAHGKVPQKVHKALAGFHDVSPVHPGDIPGKLLGVFRGYPGGIPGVFGGYPRAIPGVSYGPLGLS
jgi:hypothetical protein